MDGAYLTVPEFAGYFSLGETTVYRLVRYRTIAAVTVGRNVRIPRSEVDRLLREGGVTA